MSSVMSLYKEIAKSGQGLKQDRKDAFRKLQNVNALKMGNLKTETILYMNI